MNRLKQRKKLENILTKLDFSIAELQAVITAKEKNIILPKTLTNKKLIIAIRKNLEFLNDLEHIFITGKNILELILEIRPHKS
jgi:hypothetical protein